MLGPELTRPPHVAHEICRSATQPLPSSSDFPTSAHASGPSPSSAFKKCQRLWPPPSRPYVSILLLISINGSSKFGTKFPVSITPFSPSPILEYISDLSLADKVFKAKCKACDKEYYKVGERYGTSALRYLIQLPTSYSVLQSSEEWTRAEKMWQV